MTVKELIQELNSLDPEMEEVRRRAFRKARLGEVDA